MLPKASETGNHVRDQEFIAYSLLTLLQNKVQMSDPVMPSIPSSVNPADEDSPNARQKFATLLKKLDQVLARFTEPDGIHFFTAELMREMLEMPLLLILLEKLSNMGAGPHYLQVLGILIGVNSTVTPHLMFSKNPVLRTHGIILFDVFMDTSIGALLPMLSIWIIIQV